MSKKDCRRVRQEIEESNLGQQPGGLAAEHLRSCAECRNFYDERSRLRQIVSSLGTIEAPADFDFRLRARLANASARSSSQFSFGNLGLGMRSVVLASLGFLVVSAFLVRYLMPPGNTSTAVRTESPRQDSANVAGSLGNKPAPNALAANDRQREAGANQPDERTTSGPRKTVVARLGSNKQIASREFSSLSAPVNKTRESAANTGVFTIFPIDASHQSLKVSLDDGNGVSRTISLPTVSF